MDVKNLDDALVAIIEKKNLLSNIGYDSEEYDDIEADLHELEDEFVDEFGDLLEDALHEVHDEFCPDNDVLLPIAYLANSYLDKGEDESGKKQFDVKPGEGVIVDADDFPGEETRLVILPSPARILLQVGKRYREEVWRAN
ncbi:hypothetical protein E1171_04215 [Cytophagales bacterium RKSG123]|nr:hypothetical protein [Xanthovirga aplysinae]